MEKLLNIEVTVDNKKLKGHVKMRCHVEINGLECICCWTGMFIHGQSSRCFYIIAGSKDTESPSDRGAAFEYGKYFIEDIKKGVVYAAELSDNNSKE